MEPLPIQVRCRSSGGSRPRRWRPPRAASHRCSSAATADQAARRTGRASPAASSPPSSGAAATTTTAREREPEGRTPSTWSCSCWPASTTATSSGCAASPKATTPGQSPSVFTSLRRPFLRHCLWCSFISGYDWGEMFQVPGLRSHGEQEPQGMPPRLVKKSLQCRCRLVCHSHLRRLLSSETRTLMLGLPLHRRSSQDAAGLADQVAGRH